MNRSTGTMKKIISNVISSITGGLIAFGLAISFLHPEPEPDQSAFASFVNNVNVAPGSIKAPFDFRQAAQRAIPSVVNISVRSTSGTNSGFFPDNLLEPYESEGTGSGVIYTKNGYIITNNHVVKGAKDIEVKLYDNRIFKAQIIGKNEDIDLAVLKINAENLATLNIYDSDQLEVGEWVLAVGNPFDLNFTVTAGIVSAKGRNIDLLEDRDYAIESFIQTDASINPGNSGGALVNVNGDLLGINTAIATRTGRFQGFAFTIPINLAVRIADDIIKFGDYKRAFLGITVVDMDSELAEEIQVETSRGVMVTEIENGGSAQYAGVLLRDVILKVNGKAIRNGATLQEIVGVAKVGDTLNLEIIRKGKIIEIPVKLKSR